MGRSHEIARVDLDGYPGVQLRSPSGVCASYAPTAGMVCCSLTDRGQELLGQRDGLAAYAVEGSTMGIPLLHPWANRLAGNSYEAGGVVVEVPPDAPGVHLDGATGLPIHGLLAGCSAWEVTEAQADAGGARLVARLEVAALDEILALFPFPHELRILAELRERTLRVDTTLSAGAEAAVPVAFGYHPYFRLPDVPRTEWEVSLPVRRRALLDERFLPSGETEAVDIAPGPLGDRTYDDLFPEIDPDPSFELSGGGRRITVAFGAGYPVAVVFAPATDAVVCFEPMTAPTNPFAHPEELRWVEPATSFSASFTVVVEQQAP